MHRFRLGNGLRVLVLVDRSAPVMSYFTWFRVGSRHEKPGKTGLAHLFEHLMFNESEGLEGRRVRSQARGERRRVERRDLARLDLLLRVAPEGPLRASP